MFYFIVPKKTAFSNGDLKTYKQNFNATFSTNFFSDLKSLFVCQ